MGFNIGTYKSLFALLSLFTVKIFSEMADAKSVHSIESPERLDFNEDDDDDLAVGGAAAHAKPISLTQEEEADLLGSTDDEANVHNDEVPMIVSQDDAQEADNIEEADNEAELAIHMPQQEQQLEQPVAEPDPIEAAHSPAASAAELPDDIVSSITSSPLSSSPDAEEVESAVGSESMPSSSCSCEVAQQPTLPTSVAAVGSSSTTTAITTTVNSSNQPALQPQQRRERKRLLPRHSTPPADPNAIIDLTGESSDEDDDVGVVEKGKAESAAISGSDSNNNATPACGSQIQLITAPSSSTSSSIIATNSANNGNTDLRQVIDKQRQLKRRQFEAAEASRRQQPPLPPPPSQPQPQPARRHSLATAASISGAACRFQRPPWQRQPALPGSLLIRPHGGSGVPAARPQQQQQLQQRHYHPHAAQPDFRQSPPPPIGRAFGRQSFDARPSVYFVQQQERQRNIVEQRRWTSSSSGSVRNYVAAEMMRYQLADGGAGSIESAAPPARPQPAPPQPAMPFNVGYPSSSGRTSVRIENCPDGIAEHDLAPLTQSVGPVCEYRFVPSTYKAFVKFYSEQEATEFVRRYNRTVLKGLPLYMALTQ